jgi:predicted molibdopterin-dependent oxidoreductase YjgC
MSVRMHYADSGAVFDEIAHVSPLHRDLSYDEIAEGNAIYPYKGEPLRGATEEIRADKGTAYPEGILLGIDRPLFHSGTLSRKSPGLTRIYPEAVARMNAGVAGALSVADGDVIKISSVTGAIELPVVTDAHAEGQVVMVPNIFEGTGALGLVSAGLDPVLKSPALDVQPVKVERIGKVNP